MLNCLCSRSSTSCVFYYWFVPRLVLTVVRSCLLSLVVAVSLSTGSSSCSIILLFFCFFSLTSCSHFLCLVWLSSLVPHDLCYISVTWIHHVDAYMYSNPALLYYLSDINNIVSLLLNFVRVILLWLLPIGSQIFSQSCEVTFKEFSRWGTE